MSAPLDSIRTWSDAQLAEDISAVKYNEHQRQAKVHKEEAE